MAPTASSASAKADPADLEALMAAARPRGAAPDLAALLPPGWLLLDGLAEDMPRHLLLHPRRGVALLVLQPGPMPCAAAALGRALQGCGAPAVVLLCLPRHGLDGLAAALEQGFAGRAAPEGTAWCAALQKLLLAEGLARPVPLPRPTTRRGWRWLLGLAPLPLLALLLRQPEAMPAPPRLALPGGQLPWPAAAWAEPPAAPVLPPWPAQAMAPAALDYADWPPDPAPPRDRAGPARLRPG